MDDFEDEQSVPAAKQKKKAAVMDRALAFTGLLLAGAAAFFPWYVFFNEDKFGIKAGDGNFSRSLPDWPARNVFSVSPLAMVNKNPTEKQVPPLDALTTATVSNLGKARDGSAELNEEQPFPGKGNFRLLHVSNGRALIEDPSGMYMVRIGSILPDESKLATIEQRNGKWVIITSKGDVYGNN